MTKNGYATTYEWDESKIDGLLFPGGADVHPFYYGENLVPGTEPCIVLDRKEARLFREGRRLGVPLVGICRGAQFLCVMAGGSLWQDVNNHAGKDHEVFDYTTKKKYKVTSTHHQMMKLPRDAAMIAGAKEATKLKSEHQYINWSSPRDIWDDAEVAWIKATQSLCFQPHPEYHLKECMTYFFEKMETFIDPVLESRKA